MSDDEHFRFVKELARDLNNKNIRLPSFPDVVMRIRKALDDSETTASDLANILSNDAALASRVLILANSNYHNPAGMKIESLDAAVGRIGFEKIRTAAIAYAVEQLHQSEDLAPLKNDLRLTWANGLRVAAMSEVLARSCTALDGDNAFVAGLLNRIGVLYIFTKYRDYPGLLGDEDARQALIDEWAAPIGESIVANWDFSAEIQATLNPDEADSCRRSEPNLADVVTVARRSLNGKADTLHESAEAQRLDLTDDRLPGIMELYKSRLDSLASAVS